MSRPPHHLEKLFFPPTPDATNPNNADSNARSMPIRRHLFGASIRKSTLRESTDDDSDQKISLAGDDEVRLDFSHTLDLDLDGLVIDDFSNQFSRDSPKDFTKDLDKEVDRTIVTRHHGGSGRFSWLRPKPVHVISIGRDIGKDIGMLTRRYEAINAALVQRHGQYVDKKTLKQLIITSKNLDFDTGQVENQKMKYINPFRPEVIQNYLKRTNPWDFYEGTSSHRRKTGTSTHRRNWVEAAFIGDLIECFLFESEDGTDGIMSTHTNWTEERSPDGDDLHYESHGHVDWSLRVALRQRFDGYEGKRDPEKPHTMALVASNDPLESSMFLVSELVCGLHLAFEACRNKIYAEHRFFPSTVVSISGRDLRIVQLVLDANTGEIELRKSRPLDFEDGILAEKNEKEFFRLLGWAIGKPTGDTKEQFV